MLVYPTLRLCDVVGENPSLIPVLGRFGIRLGVGEGTVAEVAALHGVNTDLLLTALNTFLDPEYVPVGRTDRPQAADYLRRTNAFYLGGQLPNVERHLQAFIARSRMENNSLEMLRALFEDFRAALTERIAHDEAVLFPAFEAGKLRRKTHLRDEAADLLTEMLGIMVRHLRGEYDENLCYAVVLALKSLQYDMAQHERFRAGVLSAGRTTGYTPLAAQEGTLTPRETEVLRLVAQGKINREIADELCIGFQTVLSHRKHITAKLGIKSVSGLTMYALMNGVV